VALLGPGQSATAAAPSRVKEEEEEEEEEEGKEEEEDEETEDDETSFRTRWLGGSSITFGSPQGAVAEGAA